MPTGSGITHDSRRPYGHLMIMWRAGRPAPPELGGFFYLVVLACGWCQVGACVSAFL